MPREAVWVTWGGVTTDLSGTFTDEIPLPQGTIMRIVGEVFYRTDDGPPVGLYHALMGWSLNVGTTSSDPLAQGQDAESVMMRRLHRIPYRGPDTRILTTPAPDTFDVEGRRTVAAGESLWFGAEDGTNGNLWIWTYGVRVLMLLPA